MRPRNPNESKKKKSRIHAERDAKTLEINNKENTWHKRNENEAPVQKDDII